jgi:hypothetical protein
MFSSIFAIIELVLKLIGLWNGFLDYTDKKRLADAQKNTQDRNDAVDKMKGAANEDEFDKSEDDITRHKPG